MKEVYPREKLVSVVVPVYKVEKYLDRCVESIVGQTYVSLEILLIDDGSPDSCPRLCDAWAEKDNRIRVIHKQNAGLGMARNTGIEHANGRYICFFDSDDYIAPNTIELAVERAVQAEAEIVLWGMARVNAAGTVLSRTIPSAPKEVYVGSEVQDVLLPRILANDPQTGTSWGLQASACTMLLTMELIQRTGWRFVSEREMISEDVYSFLVLAAKVKRIAILREALYFYCENPASLTHSYRKDRYERNVHFYQRCLAFCDETGYSAEVKRACAGPFLGNTIAAMKQAARCRNWKEGYIQIRHIVCDDTMQQVLEQARCEKFGTSKTLLLMLMRRRNAAACYILAWLQSRRKK